MVGGEDFRAGRKALLREQTGQQAGERPARLVKLDRRRAPVGEGSGGLGAGERQGVLEPRGLEPEQRCDRRRAAERADHPRGVPAAGAHRGVAHAPADPHDRLQTCGDRDEQVAAAGAALLGDGERGRHHLGRDVAERRPMDVADRDRRDLIAVDQGRAGQRARRSGDDRRGPRAADRRGQRLDLRRLVAVPPGDRACDGVENDVGHALAHPRGQRLVAEVREECGKVLGRVDAHNGSSLAVDSAIRSSRVLGRRRSHMLKTTSRSSVMSRIA